MSSLRKTVGRQAILTGLSRRVREFVRAARDVARHRLVRCSSGNLSWRLGDGLVLIKASRSWMADATERDVCVVRLEDGEVLRGGRPSVETGMHLAVLRRRPDVNVVLHFQTSFATTLACRRGRRPDYNVIPEIPFYIGPDAHIRYYPPGTPALAGAVADALAEGDLVQMDNHGQVTVAADFAHAIQNACFFELACETIVRNGPVSHPIRPSCRPCKGNAGTV
jgi:ribulose-5-phosphate 4-epimerase/fuculose-1-phosphate aldolase